jgi:hypothetical protein
VSFQKNKGDDFTLSGDFRGSMVNIKTRVVWIGVGLMVVAMALIISSGIFNLEGVTKLFPTPTPTAFAPATEGRSLIIVANFEDRSGGKYQGIDPAQYIYEQLAAQVEKEGNMMRPCPISMAPSSLFRQTWQ